LLKSSGIEIIRKANDHHITLAHGLADLQLPVLTGDEFFLVNLGIHPVPRETMVDTAHSLAITARVAEEYLERAVRIVDHVNPPEQC
jgi:hypothetical protein